MKTALLTLALVAVAGAASAQIVLPDGTGGVIPPDRWLTHSGSGTRVQGVQLAAGPQTQMNSNMTASGAGASANPNMANAPSQPLTGPARTAQKRIEQDGYKSVQNLQQGSDGLWHGTAMRGNTPVQVTVDRSGRVSAQ